jgi:hypothetical protein
MDERQGSQQDVVGIDPRTPATVQDVYDDRATGNHNCQELGAPE